jgi:hypothetical protein
MWTASEPSTSFNPLKSGALLVIAQPAMDSSTIALADFNPYIMSVFPSLCFRFFSHWLRHIDNQGKLCADPPSNLRIDLSEKIQGLEKMKDLLRPPPTYRMNKMSS